MAKCKHMPAAAASHFSVEYSVESKFEEDALVGAHHLGFDAGLRRAPQPLLSALLAEPPLLLLRLGFGRR
eukprot:4071099-Prymnesium_polylepis.1